ncbi:MULTISPECIES: TetR family transcriptional regulator [Alishewanella]|uniref:TetR family transcriptional regulator n=1 Tax=Alishewanella jeotgali KCTC 22429 TaxID=1129374 RepID=H3ZFM1_9ALTE|nr:MULTISPECIES: TetR family transcriptional regulator [Alishewanella]EHR40633.1 TetR family transcriptional regulator [Alishewanella jeotgali KCTC 22429]MCT8124937.1 TetR family transcriptional regulator [Alishewanella sp. BS5-314]OCW98460.1 TetR family transcriptional regulator [Alishewanella sp. HH-ZS]
MARKTKAEAEATRELILDAAEQLFFQHGVSRTTLEKIAAAAGVTRGAIYWHFENKSALFSAMLERIRLPFQQMLGQLDMLQQGDPLAQLRDFLIQSLTLISSSERHFRVLSIVFLRCEYIDELNPAVSRQEELDKTANAIISRALQRARSAGMLQADVDPDLAACAIHAYLGGLIRKYLLKPDFCDLKQAAAFIDLMLNGIKKPV